MAYKSPVELICDDIQWHMEQETVKAAQHFFPLVDEVELDKALRYGRDQYEAGFHDGKMESAKRWWIPVSEPPEYPGRFLCYYETEESGEIGHCIDFGTYDEGDGWYVSGVKYWMPLPDEPHERSEDG